MRKRGSILLILLSPFIVAVMNICCNVFELEHKHPLDPENRETNGKVEITIVDPVQGQEVTMSYMVKGTLEPPEGAKVVDLTVLVHPLTTRLYWIQNDPVVDNQGNWQSLCGFGTPDQRDTVEFEVLAIIPTEKLDHTIAYAQLPGYTNMSTVVRVTRLPDPDATGSY